MFALELKRMPLPQRGARNPRTLSRVRLSLVSWALHNGREMGSDPSRDTNDVASISSRCHRGSDPFSLPLCKAASAEEGWLRHQENCREASFDGADRVALVKKIYSSLNEPHRPRRIRPLGHFC